MHKGPDTPADGLWRWIAWPVIVAVALATYHGSFTVPFLLDDMAAVVDNPTIRNPGSLAEVLMPPATAGVGGRPLANLSFALNHAGGGENVFGYHVLNLALHVAAALALFGVVRRALRLPALRARFGTRAGPVALGCALLWLVHPLQTEAVTYVSQRTEVMMGLFYFLTLYGFIRNAEAPGWRWRAVSVGACVLGALSKEIIATAPLAVWLFDRTFVAPSFRAAWRERRGYYLALMGTWLVLAALMRDVTQRGVGFGFSISAWDYLLASGRAVAHYLKLAVWPHPLVFDYGPDVARTGGGGASAAAVVTLLLLGTVAALRWRPQAGFLAAWIFLTLAPTTSVVPVAMQPMAEHRMYLPLAALCVAFGLAAGRRGGAAVVAVVAAGTVLTVARNADYRSELSLWADTVAKCPDNPRARTALGQVLVGTGRLAEAQKEFEAALRTNPDYADAHLNLGNAFLLMERNDDAARHYQQLVRLRPTFAEGHYNLANALLAAGRREAAVVSFDDAARLPFDNAELHRRLGQVFLWLQRPADARREYRAALRKEPDDATARSGVAAAEAALRSASPGR